MIFDRPRWTSRPRGISLLEVMISIGVVGVGLIGVAALIPLAHYKAAQGVREDRKALTGRRAFREFRIRDLARPGDMASPMTGPNPYYYWPTTNPYAIYNQPPDGKLTRRAYCLDPLYVAAAVDSGNQNIAGSFPSNAPVTIPRITMLSSRPDDLRRRFGPNVANQMLLNNPPVMTRAQAEETFLMRDELVFEQPEDATQPPFQQYLEGNKRYASGSYSWMATLVPDPFNNSDLYSLSIVVFYRRNLAMDVPQEIMVEVNPASFQLGLADVKNIQIAQRNQPLNKEASVKDIKTGDWIALMQQQMPNDPQTTTLKWYRVLAADELDGEADLTRELSLSGPDWNIQSPQPIYALYMKDIVAVFEKTARLYDSSMYAY